MKSASEGAAKKFVRGQRCLGRKNESWLMTIEVGVCSLVVVAVNM